VFSLPLLALLKLSAQTIVQDMVLVVTMIFAHATKIGYPLTLLKQMVEVAEEVVIVHT
jgi:hypothetical protein